MNNWEIFIALYCAPACDYPLHNRFVEFMDIDSIYRGQIKDVLIQETKIQLSFKEIWMHNGSNWKFHELRPSSFSWDMSASIYEEEQTDSIYIEAFLVGSLYIFPKSITKGELFILPPIISEKRRTDSLLEKTHYN